MRAPHVMPIVAALAVSIAIASSALQVQSATPAPKSSRVSITLPGDLSYAFKPGDHVDLANAHCLTCHSSAYVSTQPVLDRAHWAAEVTKMRKAYGAPISDTDAEGIIDYLTVAYGKP